MPTGRVRRVLFLCTGNSARSILAECVLNRLGRGRFLGLSAGSAPKGRVHPMAIDVLTSHGYRVDGLRSKSWDEFSTPGAVPLDLVITLCDGAAGETCPLWLGDPPRVHWGLPDPAAVVEDENAERAAFEETLSRLTRLVAALVELPEQVLDGAQARSLLEEIARAETGVRPLSL